MDDYDLIQEQLETIRRLKESVRWYKSRHEKLQTLQRNMRDPERTVVCDILANNALLPDPDRTRYGGIDRIDDTKSRTDR